MQRRRHDAATTWSPRGHEGEDAEPREYTVQWPGGLTLTLLLTATVAGCSGSDPEREVQNGGDTPAASASPEPSGASETPTQPTEDAVPMTPLRGEFTRGLNPAKSEAEREVAKRWFAYHGEFHRVIKAGDLDEKVLGAMATGRAYDVPADYAKLLRARNHRNVGGTIASIERIKLTGDRAEVLGCLRTTMIEVDRKGMAVENPIAYVIRHDTLEKIGNRWVVVDTYPGPNEACEYR